MVEEATKACRLQSSAVIEFLSLFPAILTPGVGGQCA